MTESLMPKIVDASEFVIAFSTKDDGNMLRTNETRIAVHNNRLRFFEKRGIRPSDLIVVRTSHSSNIDVIDRTSDGYMRHTYLGAPVIETDFDFYYSGSDGALTFRSDLHVGLMSGDCVPVMIWDNVSGLHGILHVGLLGALNQMVMGLPRVFAAIGVRLEDTHYYLGPSITQKNYNVSRSGLWNAIEDQIYDKVPEVEDFILKRSDGEYFDLQGLITSQLLEIGVSMERLQRYEHCIADPESMFLSHNVLKQGGERGNFFSVIVRLPKLP